VEPSAAPPGVPFGYLVRLQRAFAAGPRAWSQPSGIIDRWPAASWRCCGCWRRAGQTRPVPVNWWSPWTRSKACGPRPGQARRGQPHRIRGPGARIL